MRPRGASDATPGAAFEVVDPPGGIPRAPLLAHIPHASTTIPEAVRAELLLPDDALAVELDRLTDWATDELFAGLADLGATRFVNRLSRLVFDPERFLDDSAEPAAAAGQGVVYWRSTDGQPLRTEDRDLRAQRIEQLYRPYHAALDALVGDLLSRFGRCTVVDCHSFPTRPLPTEIGGAGERPDVCIGSDEVHTPGILAAALERSFREDGFVVRRNAPFAGAFVPSGFYRREPRVQAVMIEIRRGTYMDERSGQPLAAFEGVADAVRRAVAGGIAAAREPDTAP